MAEDTVDEPTEFMLTTVDNPFDPFTQYDEWLTYDTQAGHHTNSFLARIVKSSTDLSYSDELLSIQLAIEEIVTENVLGLYRKVSRNQMQSK